MTTIAYQQQKQPYISIISNHHQQQLPLQRRRVSINNRYGNQRRPLPSPPLPSNGSQKKKSVRFCSDNDLEQVRLFIKTQTPLAVQSDPPLLADDMRFDVKCPGWPSKWTTYKSLSQSVIRMENVQLVDDSNGGIDAHHHHHYYNKVLLGRCRVSNLAFEKQVIVRYSFDYWQSHREINASYREPIASTTNTWDRFTFDIELPSLSSSNGHRPLTCWIALKYHVNGQEFWDNNDGKNYQVDVAPVSTSPSTPPLQLSDNDDDDDEDDDPFLYHISSSSTDIRSETNVAKTATTTSSTPFHALDQLKFRYSFSTAQTTAIASTNTSAPSLHVGYQDFITKYCFYNSSPPSSIIQN